MNTAPSDVTNLLTAHQKPMFVHTLATFEQQDRGTGRVEKSLFHCVLTNKREQNRVVMEGSNEKALAKQAFTGRS